MSRVLQMRVTEAEMAVIARYAKQRRITMTGLIKEAVLFYLERAKPAKLPARDRFEEFLERLEKGPKAIASPALRREFSAQRRKGKAVLDRGLGKDEALAVLEKALKKPTHS